MMNELTPADTTVPALWPDKVDLSCFDLASKSTDSRFSFDRVRKAVAQVNDLGTLSLVERSVRAVIFSGILIGQIAVMVLGARQLEDVRLLSNAANWSVKARTSLIAFSVLVKLVHLSDGKIIGRKVGAVKSLQNTLSLGVGLWTTLNLVNAFVPFIDEKVVAIISPVALTALSLASAINFAATAKQKKLSGSTLTAGIDLLWVGFAWFPGLSIPKSILGITSGALGVAFSGSFSKKKERPEQS